MEQYIDELNTEEIAYQSADSLLESLSLEIMETSIKDQIDGVNDSDRDFLGTVIEKFNAINEYGDPDSVRGIKSEIIEWSDRLIKAIINKYELGYNNPGEDSLDNLSILESLYHFFIIDKTRYTKTFFINYIDRFKLTIINEMGIGGRGNDITTNANKKKKINKDNVPILSNLTEVIEHIIHNCEITPDIFIDCVDDGEIYTSHIRYLYECDMLIGNFFLNYVNDEVGNFNNEISGELRAAIRMHLSI